MNAKQSYGWISEKPSPSYYFLRLRIQAILRRLGIKSVFDMGCGNGALCRALHQDGYSVVGMEYSQEGYDIARQAYPEITFFQGNIYSPPPSLQETYPAGFDCVISTEVIEHLYSPQKLPLFAAQLLKPEGYLIISTPYHGYVKNCCLSLLNGWDAHHFSLWEGGHIKFWSHKTLTKLLLDAGFRVAEFHGCGRVPYLWKSMIVVAQMT